MIGKVTAYRIIKAVICQSNLSPSLFGQRRGKYIRRATRSIKRLSMGWQ
jgi:hypothetical protein